MTDHNRSVREDDTEGMDDLELITWSVPPHLEREPRPIGELERDWDEFARRVGIGRYRRTPASRRGPWLR